MTGSFNPGDLALIKQCHICPALVGRCVELVVLLQPGEKVTIDGIFFGNGQARSWVVSSPEGFPVLLTDGGLLEDERDPLALFRESLLMPLRDDSGPGQGSHFQVPDELAKVNA